MSNRGQSFIVEVRRKPNPDYQSKPGDARRSGRADPSGLVPVHVTFDERAHTIEARLGVVTVGAVTHDTTSKGYFWAIYLPGMPNAGQTVCSAFDVSDPLRPTFIAQIPLGNLTLPSGALRNKKSINLVYVRVGEKGQTA